MRLESNLKSLRIYGCFFECFIVNKNFGEECLNYGKLDRGVVEYKNMK